MKLQRRPMTFSIVLCTACMTICSALPAWSTEHSQRRQAQMYALANAEINLVQAISNIESASGARVVKVEVDPHIKPLSLFKGPMVYELLTVKGNTFKAYFLDIASGKVLDQREDWFGHWRFRSLSGSDILAQAKFPLTQAIVLAEKQTDGKTVQAATAYDEGILFYQITTMVNNQLRRVNIDAFSGKLTEFKTDKHGHFED
jgi:uncharacterized membrane protein YkoI